LQRAMGGKEMPVERQAADTLVVNALVRTLDPADSTARAMAIKDGRIVALGSEEEVRSLADRQTRVIDGGGRTVLPAFTDGHTHFHGAALTRAYFIDFES